LYIAARRLRNDRGIVVRALYQDEPLLHTALRRVRDAAARTLLRETGTVVLSAPADEAATCGIIATDATERMPFEVKIPHARQVALYVAATRNNYEGRLSYVTPKKAATYRLENMPEHLKALHQIALRVENFLSLSDDPEFFKSITVPDLESFYWTSPAARQLAYELWKI